MKLICEQCGARYSIADDKVRGKVFKIRCKKCDNVIVVKGDADGGGALGIGAASLGEMAQASPGEMSPERSPYEHMAAGQEPSSWQGGMEGRGATPPPAEPPYAAAIPVWYVLIGQQQLGPLTQEQLGGYITSGEASAESYVWREGFTDWVQLHMLEEFAAYLQAAPAPGDPYLQHPGQAMGEDAGGQDGYGYHEAGKASPGAVPQDWAGMGQAGYASSVPGSLGDDGMGVGMGMGMGMGAEGGDVFYSSSASSGGMFAGYDSPGVPGPLAVPAANRMVGERNENSVLFSLATLQNLAMGSPEMGQGAVAVAPSTSSTSSSSGLIDIRSLADAEPGAAAEPIGGAIPAPAPPPLAPAMMVPVMPRRSAPIGLIVGLASAGVVVVALSIVLTILLLHQPPSPAPGVVIPGAVAGVEKPGQQPASAASGAQVAIAPSAAKSSEPGAGGATGGPAEGTGSAQAEGEQLASPSGRPRPAGAAPAAPSSAAGAAAARPRPAAAAPAPAPRPAAAVAVAPAPPPAARTAPVAAAPAAPRKGSTSEVDDLLSRIEPAPAPAAAAPPRPAPAPAPAPAAAAAPAAGQQKSLEREDIAAVVRANKGKVQSCYERQAEPKLSGTLMVSFVIQRSGQVSSAAIRTPTFEGTPVGQCVLSAVRSFVFPAHTDPPVKINYPFILR